MQVSRRLTKGVALTLAATVAINSLSCGTILYPERRGQPRGMIDPGVLLLDAVGLIFFVVPGLVAFAVDFSTGAIYMPPTSYSGPLSQNGMRREDLVRVDVAKDELTRDKIEQVVARQTGRPVSLKPGQFRASEISDLDQFDDESARLGNPEKDAPATDVRFRMAAAE